MKRRRWANVTANRLIFNTENLTLGFILQQHERSKRTGIKRNDG
jgi:hypothetical protein